MPNQVTGSVPEALLQAAASLEEAVGTDMRIADRAVVVKGGKELRALFRDVAVVFERARQMANERAGRTDR